MADNPYSGDSGSNPYAQQGNAAMAAPASTPDSSGVQQVLNDQSQMVPNDDLGNQTSDSASITAACMDCGRTSRRASLNAASRCKCGSQDLVYEAKNEEWFFDESQFNLPDSWIPQPDSPDPSDPDVAIRFASGAVGWVGKNNIPGQPGKWLWDFEIGGNILHEGNAESKDQAQRIIEALVSRYNKPITEARKMARRYTNPHYRPEAISKARNQVLASHAADVKVASSLLNDQRFSKLYLSGRRSITGTVLQRIFAGNGRHRFAASRQINWNNVASLLNSSLHLDLSRRASLSRLHSARVEIERLSTLHTIAGDFPPAKDDDKKKKDDSKDEKDGEAADAAPAESSDAPPVGDPVASGADPQNPTKDAPPAEQDPSMQDPNAVADPNAAAPLSTDPMDRAQATLEAQVDAVNQLGHDAMETAYDVDELFSEWRCMNCEQEGRADISEDGQVAFSGDLLEQPQGCTAPAMGGDVPPVDPSQQVAPQTNDQVPAQDGEITQGVQAKKRKFIRNPFRRDAATTTNFENELNNVRPNLDSHNEPDEAPAPISQGQDSLDVATARKVQAMTNAILQTNPGMNRERAYQYAKKTVQRFPSVTR